MNTLETMLNNAVEEKGWRISPRASLEDRLVRYLTLTWSEQNKELSEENARGAAQLMILKHSGGGNTRHCSRTEANNDVNASVWSGRTRHSARTEANNNVNTNSNVWSGRTEAPGTTVWSGRTRSSTRSDSDESAPTNRTVSATRDGTVRVTFTSNGTHPMVRRSQVSSSR